MVWGSFLIAAAALKTPTRNGYNAQGVNLKFRLIEPRKSILTTVVMNAGCPRILCLACFVTVFMLYGPTVLGYLGKTPGERLFLREFTHSGSLVAAGHL